MANNTTTAPKAPATTTTAPKAQAPKAQPKGKAQGKAQAPKAQPKGKAQQAPQQAPQAPRYVMGPWPVKAQAGNTIRAYCYSVAKALAAQHPKGFTAAQYASALAGAAAGSSYKQPSAGWGTVAKPNGNALAHANWFAHPKQGWLAPAPAGK